MRHQTIVLLLLIALAGCRGASDGNSGGSAESGPTGLYEVGEGSRRNQMCLVERHDATRFGLVVWAREGNASCTGTGRASRDGGRLSLAMQGDDSCVIEARVEGSRVTLPSTLPPGCAYYCGPGVEMAGSTFDQAGETEDDARRAVDLVGDPLCG